jgi:hypothetical protein
MAQGGVRRFLGVGLVIILYGGAVRAEEELSPGTASPFRIQVEAAVDKNVCRENEDILLRIILRWKERFVDLHYRLPKPPLENLVLVESRQSAETRLEAGRRVYERILTYRLRPVKAGQAAVGSFFLEYRLPDSLEMERARIPAQAILVRRVWLSPRMIRAIGMAAVVFLAVAAFALLWKAAAARRKPAALEETTTLSRLEDDSILALSRIEGLRESERVRDFMSQCGDVFRQYLQNKFGLAAARVGSLELLEMFERRRDIPAEERNKVKAILESLTESQFAGIEPTAAEAQRISSEIHDFILRKKVV